VNHAGKASTSVRPTLKITLTTNNSTKRVIASTKPANMDNEVTTKSMVLNNWKEADALVHKH